jgi:hypothetical protein
MMAAAAKPLFGTPGIQISGTGEDRDAAAGQVDLSILRLCP